MPTGRWWRIVLVALAAGVFAAPAQATGADPSATQPAATDPATSTTAPADSSTTPSSTDTTAPADTGASSTSDPSGSTAPAGSTSTTPADSGSTQPTTTDTTSSSTAPTGTDSSTGSSTGSTDPASPPPSSSTDTTQAPTDSAASSSQSTTDVLNAPPATDATTPAPAANPAPAPAPTPESILPAESTATIASSPPPGIEVAAQDPGAEVRDVNRQLAPFSWFLPPGQLADEFRAIPPGRLTAAQLLRPELAHLLLRRALILPLLELRGTRAWLLTDASSPLALARSAAKRAADADAQSSSRAGGGTSPLPQFPPHFPPQPDAPSGFISSAGGSATTFAFGAFAILLAAFSLVAPRRRWVVRFGTNSLHSLAIVSLPERPG